MGKVGILVSGIAALEPSGDLTLDGLSLRLSSLRAALSLLSKEELFFCSVEAL
jgi:hypothetical protein